MTMGVVHLPEDVIAKLDRLVGQMGFSMRAEAVSAALDALLADRQTADLDHAIVDGYGAFPQTDDELAMADAATRALIEEEPW